MAYLIIGIYNENTSSTYESMDPNVIKNGMEYYFDEDDKSWMVGRKLYSCMESISEIDINELTYQLSFMRDQFEKLGYDPEDVKIYMGNNGYHEKL